MIRLNEFQLGVLTAVLATGLLYASSAFAPIPGQDYGAGTMPRLIAWCGIALGVYMMASSLRTLPGALTPHLAEWTRSRRSVLSALAVLAVILFYIFFSEMLGFIPTSFIGLFALMLALRSRPHVAALASIATTLVVYYAFSRMLLVPLPRTEWLSFLG